MSPGCYANKYSKSVFQVQSLISFFKAHTITLGVLWVANNLIRRLLAAEILLVHSRRDADSYGIRGAQNVFLGLELRRLLVVKSYEKPTLLLLISAVRANFGLRLDEHAFRFENFLVEVGLPLSQRIIPVQILVLKLRQDLFQVLAFHSFGHGLETTAVLSQIDSYHLALLVLLDL